MNVKNAVLVAVLMMIGAFGTANADIITLEDETEFTPTGTDSPEDYVDHKCGDVNYIGCGLLGTGDFVTWDHLFQFDPAAEEILSGLLTVTIRDDERKDCGLFLSGCEFAFGFDETGEWAIGEVDTGSYDFDVAVGHLADGSYRVTVGSLLGDFYLVRSVLTIEYVASVPEPGTLALLGLGLLGVGVARRRKA